MNLNYNDLHFDGIYDDFILEHSSIYLQIYHFQPVREIKLSLQNQSASPSATVNIKVGNEESIGKKTEQKTAVKGAKETWMKQRKNGEMKRVQ